MEGIDLQPMLMHALEIALHAHATQKDKRKDPYILHVMRVVNSPRLIDMQDRIVAALHDVVEDSSFTFEDLSIFYPGDVHSIKCLTRRKDQAESYDVYIERVITNKRAMRVKLADLDDHISRLQGLSHDDRKRLAMRYIAARERIEQAYQLRKDSLL